MKKVLILASLMMLTIIGISNAQSTPTADARQQNQKTRIKQGVVSGEVTRMEASKLRKEQRHIKKAERRAKADGEVTAKERAKLQRKQNKASRNIARQKHDPQDRPKKD